MAFSVAILVFPTTPTPTGADMNYTIVVIGGVMALSLIYYYFPKYGGVYWFKGPIRTVPKTPDDGASMKDSMDEKKDATSGMVTAADSE